MPPAFLRKLFLLAAISLNACKSQVTEPLHIAIQPFDSISGEYLIQAKAALETHYGVQVTLLHPISLPKHAWYAPRSRYRADSIIHFLARHKTGRYDKILGLTTQDISTSKGKYKDWGVMGLGYRPGPSCVVSLFRLKRGNPTSQLLEERLQKVVLHEVGHTLGLPHCSNKSCLMRSAQGKLATIDEAKSELCDLCKEKINLK